MSRGKNNKDISVFKFLVTIIIVPCRAGLPGLQFEKQQKKRGGFLVRKSLSSPKAREVIGRFSPLKKSTLNSLLTQLFRD